RALAATGSGFLHRRTGYRAVRAKDAAIACFRSQCRATLAADIEDLASIRRHRLTLDGAAVRTFDVRMREDFRLLASRAPAEGLLARMPCTALRCGHLLDHQGRVQHDRLRDIVEVRRGRHDGLVDPEELVFRAVALDANGVGEA